MKAFIKGGLIAEISKSQKRIKFDGNWYSIQTALNGRNWFMYSDRKTTRSIQFALFNAELFLHSDICINLQDQNQIIEHLEKYLPEDEKKNTILVHTRKCKDVFRYTDKWECMTNWNKIENLEYVPK